MHSSLIFAHHINNGTRSILTIPKTTHTDMSIQFAHKVVFERDKYEEINMNHGKIGYKD